MKAYVLKSISIDDSFKKANSFENIFKEQKILMKLCNQHIIRLYYGFRVKNEMYEIMEYASGKDLSQYLKSRPHGCIGEDEARWIIGQVCRGIDYCHQEGVIHRNIKPQNLLIENVCTTNMIICENSKCSNIDDECIVNSQKLYKDMVIKISDFNSASIKNAAFGKGKVSIDDLLYKPPEVLNNKAVASYGRAIDVWAIGVILFEMLFGYHPFEGKNWDEIKDNIIKNQIQYRRRNESGVIITLSPECYQLIDGMLIKDPYKRWSLRQVINNKWFSIHSTVNVPKLSTKPTLK